MTRNYSWKKCILLSWYER